MSKKKLQDTAGIIRDFLRTNKNFVLSHCEALELAARLDGKRHLHQATTEATEKLNISGEFELSDGGCIEPPASYGRGSRKRTRLTKHGFPRGYLAPAKSHFGFRTGDLVTASVPSGVNAGRHTGRVAVRASGSFNIQSTLGTAQGISHKHCRKLQQLDPALASRVARGRRNPGKPGDN